MRTPSPEPRTLNPETWPLTLKDPLVPASPFGSLIKAEVSSNRCAPSGALYFSGDPATGVWTGQLDGLAFTLNWPGVLMASFGNWSGAGSPFGGGIYCWTFTIDGPPCAPEGATFSICLFSASQPPECAPTCNCDCGCGCNGGGGGCGDPSATVQTLMRNSTATCMTLDGGT